MNGVTEKPPFAWQPLTPAGVAAFAYAKPGRLLFVQFLFALLASASVVWFLHRDWFPVVADAIRKMPEQGEIRDGRLDWRGEAPVLLAEGRFLAISIDPNHSGDVRSPAHVQLEFGSTDYQVMSLFGYARYLYPRTGAAAAGFNRLELTAWWGAWAPAFLAIAAGGVLVGLMVTWAILSTLYSGLAWLVGFYANRDLSWRASWRLSGAALMPGALFMSAAIVLYGFGGMDLLPLLVAAAAHVLLGWVYVVLSPLELRLHPEVPVSKKNPFRAEQPR